MIITPESERQTITSLLHRCASAMESAAGQVKNPDLEGELHGLAVTCHSTVTLLEPVAEPAPCKPAPKAKATVKKAKKK